MLPFHSQEVVRLPPVSEIAIPAAEVISKCIFVFIQYPSSRPFFGMLQGSPFKVGGGGVGPAGLSGKGTYGDGKRRGSSAI